jgi:hypothetical protein
VSLENNECNTRARNAAQTEDTVDRPHSTKFNCLANQFFLNDMTRGGTFTWEFEPPKFAENTFVVKTCNLLQAPAQSLEVR